MTNNEQLTEARTALKNLKKRFKIKNCRSRVATVQVTRQGNFTLVEVNGGVIGMSKRMCKDPPNPVTGFHMALNKALKFMLKIK